MQAYEFRAYEGKKPYIFISYAHKDADRVLPILAQLDKEGYRVWYDEGIEPGSEWPENIAQHLNGCAIAVALVSANSMASPNCRREITYALAKKKPFVSVFLEETVMSPGMELQMSAQQCIMKYGYRNEAHFFEKLYSCSDLAPCKREPDPAPAEMPPEEPAPVKDPPKQAKPAAQKSNAAPGKKLWIPIAAAAVVVLALVLVLILGGGNTNTPTDPQLDAGSTPPSGSTAPSGTTAPIETNKPTEATKPTRPNFTTPTVSILPDMTVNEDVLALSLRDVTISAQTVTQLNKLTALQSLSFENCSFEPNALSGLAVATLKNLTVNHASGISSFRFLNTLPNLINLILIDAGVNNNNFSGLTLEALTQLTITENPEFTDLKSLSGCSGLTSLNFRSTGVADVSALADLTKLKSVCGAYTAVTNIDPLASLENLLKIDFTGCDLGTITAPFYSLYLEELRLNGCSLTDISGLHHMTVLTVADLGNNQLKDVAFLAKSANTLKTLSLSYNPLEAENLEFLLDCHCVKELHISGIAMVDLSICCNMSGLQILEASHCQLTSLAGLSTIGSLKTLQVPHNLLTDFHISSSQCADKISVDLSYNQLTVLSSMFATFGTVSLAGNPDIAYNSYCITQGTTLVAHYSDTICNAADNFTHFVVIDCPLDQIVALQTAFGKENVTFINSEEAFQSTMADLGFFYP